MKSKKIMLYLHSVTREVNMAVKSWEVSDEFWARVAPLIPKVKRDPKKKLSAATRRWSQTDGIPQGF